MMGYVEEFLGHFPSSWPEVETLVRESTWGGVDGKSCTSGTFNRYQQIWEPEGWGCKNGSSHLGGIWYVEGTQSWMSRHYEVPWLFSLAYIIVIFGLQWLMKTRPAFSLKPILIIWNFLLAAFSIVGAYYVVPPILRFSMGPAQGDWKSDVCTTVTEIENPWVFFFIISKIPELLDTVFLALRKRPIIFLHWYHHIATMLYCWDAWSLLVPAGGPFAAMNLVVHSLMYTYYCIMAIGIRLPSFLASVITTLQIVQMIGGIIILTTALSVCPTSYLASDFRIRLNYYLGLAMYASYAFLFIKFFIQRYFLGASAPRQSPTDVAKKQA